MATFSDLVVSLHTCMCTCVCLCVFTLLGDLKEVSYWNFEKQENKINSSCNKKYGKQEQTAYFFNILSTRNNSIFKKSDHVILVLKILHWHHAIGILSVHLSMVHYQ